MYREDRHFFFKEPIRKGNTKKENDLTESDSHVNIKPFSDGFPYFVWSLTQGFYLSWPINHLWSSTSSHAWITLEVKVIFYQTEQSTLPKIFFQRTLKKSGPFFFACFWHTKYTLYGLTHKWITLSCIFDSTSFLSENELSHLPDPAYIPIYLSSKTCFELQLSCFSSSQY